MTKGRKQKGRGGRASSPVTAAPVEKASPAPQKESPDQAPLTPNPPRRNVPLLVVSVVLLVLWLSALAWMAAVS